MEEGTSVPTDVVGKQGQEDPLPPRLGGAFLLLIVGLVGAAAFGGGGATLLFWVMYALLPTIVAALLSLVSWADRRQPQQVLLTFLIITLIVAPFVALRHYSPSLGESVLFVAGVVVVMAFVWLPQATVALLYFQLQRAGGARIAPRFSLRTFLVLITVVAIALAGAHYYEQSKEIVSVAEEFKFSELRGWPASRRDRTDAETESLRREASKLIITHFANYVLEEG